MHFKKIGITTSTPYWQAVLDQLGCFWEEVSQPLEEYSLVIITDKSSCDYDKYIRDGGAVIDSIGKITRKLTGQWINKTFCKSETVTVRGLKEQLDLYSNVLRVEGELSKTYTFENGHIGFWGIPMRRLKDKREMRKAFFLNAPILPAEELSKVSKGVISRLLFDLLVKLHTCRGLTFIHKNFSPQTSSPLLFRMDSDWGTQERVNRWHTLTRSLEINTSWFLHVQAHEEWLDTFRSFPNDEIGLHCYRHITKPTNSDIDKALKKLTAVDLKAIGYAAPYGIHRKEVDAHLLKRGFSYGSDFSFIYDSLPLQLPNHLLQIPVFPLSMGSFNFGFQSDHDVKTFFADYINRQLYLGEPVALFDHPEKGNIELMETILSLALECGAISMTFEEFTQFWQKRVQDQTPPELSELTLSNRCSVPIRVWSGTSESFLLKPGGSCHSGKQGSHLPPPRPQIPYKKVNRFSLRQFKNSILHRYFWRKRS